MKLEFKFNFKEVVSLLKKMKKFGLDQLEKIENQPISFKAWFISFMSFVFLRNFLETFSSGHNFLDQKSWAFFLLHSTSFYFFTFLFFILAIHFITGERVERVSRSSVWLAPWFLLAPIVDKIFFGNTYVPMRYTQLQAGNFGELLGEFYNLLLFGPNGLLQFAHIFWSWGDDRFFADVFSHSFGLKIELEIITLLGVIYVFLKTKSVLKSLLFLFAERVIMFFVTAFPFFVTIAVDLPNSSSSFHEVSKLNPDYSWNFIVFSLFSILIIFFSAVWFWRYDKNKFLALFKNVRFERLALYLGAFYFGIYLAAPGFRFNFFDILLVVIGSLSIMLSWMFAVGSNDLADEGGDCVSKPDRPLPSGKLSKDEVKNLNLIFRIASYLLALTAGYAFFMTILIRSAVSYLYSNHPFRLKRFPFISTFCIASAVILGALGGYLLFSENVVFAFPKRFIFFIAVFFTLGMNFIHINDCEGDKKEGVWTLPVIFGETAGKKIVAICLAAAFLSTLLFYPEASKSLVLVVLIFSVLGFRLVAKKKFKENHVLFLCAVFAVIFILFFERPLWPILMQ